jgi:hemolysin activation/secretion protein
MLFGIHFTSTRNLHSLALVFFLILLLAPGATRAQFAPDPSIGRNLPDSIPEAAPDAFVRRPSELETKPDYSDVPIVGQSGTGTLHKIIISGALSPGDKQEGIQVIDGIEVDRIDLLTTERPFAVALQKEYINHSLTMEVVRAICQKTLHFYFKHERPLVFIQPVTIDYEQGILRLAVVEATIDRKVDTGAKWFSKKLLLSSLRAKVGEHLDRRGLLNDVAILNQNPFMQNSAVLKRGEKPGTTTLDLRTQDAFPIRGFFSIDNTGSQQTGPWRWSAGANWGNAFFEGGQLSYQYSAPFQNPDSQPVQSLNFLQSLPWKHLLSIYGSYSTTNVKINTGTSSLTDSGSTKQISPRYIIPVGKMYGKVIQNFTLGADWISSNLFFLQGGNQVPANQTDVVQGLLGYQILVKDTYGQTSLATDNYWSPGGLTPNNSTQKFQNVDPRTKANYFFTSLHLQRENTLPYGCSLLSMFSGQLASSSLISNEQLSIGGYGTVRGYPQQILFGDQGVVYNLELHSPSYSIFGLFRGLKVTPLEGIPDTLQKIGKDKLMFLTFWDYGLVNSIKPLPGNPASYAITALGVGVRYGISEHFTLRCDLGFPLINPNVGIAIGPTIAAGASVSF